MSIHHSNVPKNTRRGDFPQTKKLLSPASHTRLNPPPLNFMNSANNQDGWRSIYSKVRKEKLLAKASSVALLKDQSFIVIGESQHTGFLLGGGGVHSVWVSVLIYTHETGLSIFFLTLIRVWVLLTEGVPNQVPKTASAGSVIVSLCQMSNLGVSNPGSDPGSVKTSLLNSWLCL